MKKDRQRVFTYNMSCHPSGWWNWYMREDEKKKRMKTCGMMRVM